MNWTFKRVCDCPPRSVGLHAFLQEQLRLARVVPHDVVAQVQSCRRGAALVCTFAPRLLLSQQGSRSAILARTKHWENNSAHSECWLARISAGATPSCTICLLSCTICLLSCTISLSSCTSRCNRVVPTCGFALDDLACYRLIIRILE